jgi:YqaJ-like viral recombinase domain
MAIFHTDIDQGSLAWMKLRKGRPTASEFDSIITPKQRKMAAARWKYACRLVAERLLNWQTNDLTHIQAIADGKAGEPMAVAQFGFVTDQETYPVGFVTTNDGRFGASPDRIMSPEIDDGKITACATVIEIKAPTIPIQIQYLASPSILSRDASANVAGGDSYICQVQGQLFVAEAEQAVFYSYHPRMPAFMLQTHRDTAFIRSLADALEQFSDELEWLTEAVKALGTFDAFAELVTPLDAARGPETERQLADMIEGEAGSRLAWGA